MDSYRLADPSFLWLLLLLPAALAWYWKKSRKKTPGLKFSSVSLVHRTQARSAEWSRYVLISIRLLVLALVILALTRPQSGLTREEIKAEGIDIVLAVDISSSMLAEDLKPNRVEAAKEVAAQFIQGRVNDRIGLVVFAGKAYTQCPLTLDYDILLNLFSEIEVGLIEDGTAIGMGLGVAVNRLKESEAKSKVIVLLTDGRNNRGEIDPRTAAQLAQTFGIKIYSIGAGAHGMAPYPVDDPLFGRRYAQFEVDIDDKMLTEIASSTGGSYYRATDRESLEKIYSEVDQLEKTEVEVTQFTRYSELFHFPLGLAVLLLAVEIGLANTKFRRIP
jgi:Ca-activated chloride channel family protein